MSDHPSVKKAPNRPRQSYTFWVPTPIGKLHVTVSQDPDDEGQPFDVFAVVSKAGSDTSADLDGMARLISLFLRTESFLSPREKLKLAAAQLKGIATSREEAYNGGSIRSVPEGFAVCLEEMEALLFQREQKMKAAGTEQSLPVGV